MARNNNSNSTGGSPVKSDEENVLSNFDYTDDQPLNSAPLPAADHIETNAELVTTASPILVELQPPPQSPLPLAPLEPPPPTPPPLEAPQPLPPAPLETSQPLSPAPRTPLLPSPMHPLPRVSLEPPKLLPPASRAPLQSLLPAPLNPLQPEPVQSMLPAPLRPLLLASPAAAVQPSVLQPLIDRRGPSQVPPNISNDSRERSSSWDIGFINSLLQQLGSEVDNILGIAPESSVTPKAIPYTLGEFDCNGCSNFGDILHTNGIRNVRLTLHGGFDVLDHLLFQIETFERDSVRLDYYYLDLSSHPLAWTKTLLVIYLNYLMADRAAIMMDTTSSFYESVENGTVNRDAAGPSNAAEQPPEPRPRARSRSRSKLPKTGLALQRERASRLTPMELSPHFKGPITLAARALGLCPTAIKHACRRLGIARWPSRKLNSISRQIGNLERELATLTNPDRIRDVIISIDKLKAQYQRIMNCEPDQEEGEAGEEEGESEEDSSEGGDSGKHLH